MKKNHLFLKVQMPGSTEHSQPQPEIFSGTKLLREMFTFTNNEAYYYLIIISYEVI